MSTIWEENESEDESFISSDVESGAYVSADDKDDLDDDWTSFSTGWQSDEDGGKSSAMSLLSLTHQEGVQLMHLKKHIGILKRNIDRCNQEVSTLRENLNKCQKNQLKMKSKLNRLDDKENPPTELDVARYAGIDDDDNEDDSDIELAMLHGRKAGQGLLQGKRNQLEMQMNEEIELEKNIKEALIAAEDRLLEAQMSAKEFEEFEADLEAGEAAMKKTKERKLARRLETEARLVANARKQNWNRQQPHKSRSAEVLLDGGGEVEKQREAAMQRVLTRQRDTQRRAQEEQKQHMEKRMNAILSLKKNITANEDILQAQSMLRKDQKQKKEEAMKREILEEGGDLLVETIRRQRLEQFQKKMAELQKKQETKKMEIVAKLLKEEESIKPKNDYQLPSLGQRKKKRRRKRKKKEKGEEFRKRSGSAPSEILEAQKPKDKIEETLEEKLVDGSGIDEIADQLSTEDADHLAVQPEIQGMWDGEGTAPTAGEAGKPPALWLPKSHSSYGKYDGGESSPVKKRVYSTTEKRMMQTALEKLREGIVRKQVAAGREFKGVAFTSQPAVVLFQDFIVGQTYSKDVKLTNVSYTVNHCKFVGVSPSLVDTVSVSFDPPGSMSAGMTCHLLITFQPQLEEDSDGEVMLLSETGPFSIPVRCSTKKCQIKLDHTHLDFGKVCVGEMVKRQMTIHNTGALSTNYSISRSHAGLEPSLVVKSEEPDEATDAGKLTDKSETSVKSDFGIYGRSVEEMARLGSVSGDYKTKSKSMGNMEVLASTDGTTSSEEKHDDYQATTGTVEGHHSVEPHTTVEGKGSQVSGIEQCISPTESLAGKEGRVGLEKQDATDAAEDTTQLEKTESLEGDTSSSIGNIGVVQAIPSAIMVEGPSNGTVEGFSSQTIRFAFSPSITRLDSTEFFLIFSHPTQQTLKVSLVGEGIQVPVYLKQEEVDMKICLVDRHYQCGLVLCNRGVTARQVTFKVPTELQSYLEVLPGHSVVQGNDSLSVQLKFNPGQPLLRSGSARDKFADSEGKWRMTVTVEVGGQSQPVLLTVLAEVSPSALVLLPHSLDFGCCTTQETVTHSISITNTSALIQSFGFVHLPSFIDVQPGDGFGDILPGETIQLEVLFSPDKSKDYKFEVTCKSLLDQTCKIQCTGRGILSPMELSASHVIFPTTRLGSTSRGSFTLTNSKLSRLSSARIRGTAPAQGTRAFVFSLPPNSPFSLSPHVGVLKLGESICIKASFSPQVTEKMIQNRHVQIAAKKSKKMVGVPDVEAVEETISTSGKAAGSAAKKANPRLSKNLKAGGNMLSVDIAAIGGRRSTISPFQSPTSSTRKLSLAVGSGVTARRKNSPGSASSTSSKSPTLGSKSWWKLYHSVVTDYKDTDLSYTVPCFISDVLPAAQTPERLKTLKHQPNYTLYLNIAGKIVKPEIVLTNNCSTTVDFGRVVTGDVGKAEVTLENTSEETVKIWSSVLDPLGPFSLRNALRPLLPHCTHTLLFHFTPQAGKKTYDTLTLFYGKSASCLELNLTGKGVPLDVTVVSQAQPEEGADSSNAIKKLTQMDLGHVMIGDSVTKNFEVHNNTPLPVHFSINLQSQLPEKIHAKLLEGMSSSGRPGFSCQPKEGTVDAEDVKEVKITFDPDRQSSLCQDQLMIEFNGKPSSPINIIGQAWNSNMYVMLNNVKIDLHHSSNHQVCDTAIEPLLSPTTASGTLPQILVVLFQYSMSGLHSSVSTATTMQNLHEKRDSKAILDQDDQDGEGSRSKSENSATSQKMVSPESHSARKTEEKQATSYKKELIIGCIKSSLVKKQSGEYVIEALNAASNPLAKCFTIDPLKASVEGGSTRIVTVTFTPPNNATSYIEASTTLTLKGESSQTIHLTLRATVSE